MITLVLGGASSGKSAVAERLASSLAPPVTYVATWTDDWTADKSDKRDPESDPDMAARIERHRARRPAAWATIEAAAGLAAVVAETPGTLLIDALGTWVASAPDLAVDTAGLCRALKGRTGDAVIVSDEVGLGVHPSTDVGRRFREALGAVNLAVAEVADRVWLVVAGHVMALTPAPVSAPLGAPT